MCFNIFVEIFFLLKITEFKKIITLVVFYKMKILI